MRKPAMARPAPQTSRSDAAPRYYQREQRDWIEVARRELATLPRA